jgi:hypothetical protein
VLPYKRSAATARSTGWTGEAVRRVCREEDVMRKLDRRQFTQEASLAFLAGVSVTVSACGGGGGGDYQSPTGGTAPPTAAGGSKTGQISSNHGHQAVITAAELQTGGSVRIDIAYQAGHSHIVELPPQAVQEIRDGRPASKESTTTDAHSHMVTFNAESPEEPSRY